MIVILWGIMIIAGASGLIFGDVQMRGSILLIVIGIAVLAAMNAVGKAFERRRAIYRCEKCHYWTRSAWAAEAHSLRFNHPLERERIYRDR